MMEGYKLIISNANAMYTNINTDHVIDTLRKWFKQHEKDLPGEFKTELILKGIERLMKHNLFTFGKILSPKKQNSHGNECSLYVYNDLL